MAADKEVRVLLVDTREQLPYDFSGFQATTVRATLPAGDYALSGYEGRAVVERKQLDDLVACCMGDNRARFERELETLRGYEMAAVVVEGSMDDVAHHRYRSLMKPHAVLQSCFAFQVRYRVPFVWAGSRRGAEYAAYWLLAKFARHGEKFGQQVPRHPLAV